MALVAESGCTSPIAELTKVISEVTGHYIRHEFPASWKRWTSRLEWIRSRKRRIVRVHKSVAKICVDLAKCSSEHCHRWIVSGFSLGRGSWSKDVPPLRRTDAFPPAESSPKISGDAEMAENPSCGFVAPNRLEIRMLVSQTFEHRLRLEKQIPALSREYFTRHEESWLTERGQA